ncbi:tail fiber assembly protein [Photorhabdus temperata]|nr:tail fiber assembly protein [Photorhabdus temperata]
MKKQELMEKANERITPLQDAVDLSMATEVESLALQAWKKYRVMLNRVDTSKVPEIN